MLTAGEAESAVAEATTSIMMEELAVLMTQAGMPIMMVVLTTVAPLTMVDAMETQVGVLMMEEGLLDAAAAEVAAVEGVMPEEAVMAVAADVEVEAVMAVVEDAAAEDAAVEDVAENETESD